MRLVNEAWEVLGKPETRAEYDAVYFAWRAAEYARRATVADEVRRGYARERHEREAREAEERRAAAERASDGSRSQGTGASSHGVDSDGGDSGSHGDFVSRRRENSGLNEVGILVGIVVAAAVILGIIGWSIEASQDRARSERAATQTASAGIYMTPSPTPHRVHVTPTPAHGTLRSTIGDGLIQCAPALFGNSSGFAENFGASVNFRVPTSSEWSIGFRYHIGRGSHNDASTFIYKDRRGGARAYHSTRLAGASERDVGPEWISPQSALDADGVNFMQIDVRERGSYLWLNRELQIHVPNGHLNPRSSRVQFCVGFLADEVSEYELEFWNLGGRAW